MAKLFVVCGHGAGDPGSGGFGFSEAERVRTLAAEMQRIGGDEVVVGDTSINWYASGKFNTVADPGCPVVELHMDAAGADARGGHVIIAGGLAPDAQDTALAAYISGVFPGRASTIVNRAELANCRICARRGINYRLLECCFITNRGDLEKFNANIPAIAAGILEVFGITSTPQPEPVEPVVPDPVDYPPRQIKGDEVHRLYNPNTGEHFWTSDPDEAESLEGMGWTDEHVAWRSPVVQIVYRLMNPYSGLHFWTVDHGEACALIDQGWKWERDAVAFASTSATDNPIYRLYNASTAMHMFTANPNERTALIADGWTDEGIAFYV